MIDNLTRILAFLGRALTWFCVVQPWEEALRVRLGNKISTFKPGIHFIIPFADVLYVQNMRLRVIHCNEQTITTADGKPLCVTGNISFQVNDIYALYQSVHQPEYVLRRDVQAAIALYVSNRTIIECHTSELENFVNASLDLERYGLTGNGFCLTDWLIVKSIRLINQGLGEWINSNFNTDQPRISSVNSNTPGS